MILSLENTMVTMVISELKSIYRLKIFRETEPKLTCHHPICVSCNLHGTGQTVICDHACTSWCYRSSAVWIKSMCCVVKLKSLFLLLRISRTHRYDILYKDALDCNEYHLNIILKERPSFCVVPPDFSRTNVCIWSFPRQAHWIVCLRNTVFSSRNTWN